MIVLIDKSFEKDTYKITDSSTRKKISKCIINVKQAETLKEIKNLGKLTGYHVEYRIKSGDYRVGLIIEHEKVIFVRFLHRKDIYKYFPR